MFNNILSLIKIYFTDVLYLNILKHILRKHKHDNIWRYWNVLSTILCCIWKICKTSQYNIHIYGRHTLIIYNKYAVLCLWGWSVFCRGLRGYCTASFTHIWLFHASIFEKVSKLLMTSNVSPLSSYEALYIQFSLSL